MLKWRCEAHMLMKLFVPLDTFQDPKLPAGGSPHRHTIIWAPSHFSCQRVFAHGAPGALWVDR